jgi:hypothetical protein
MRRQTPATILLACAVITASGCAPRATLTAVTHPLTTSSTAPTTTAAGSGSGNCQGASSADCSNGGGGGGNTGGRSAGGFTPQTFTADDHTQSLECDDGPLIVSGDDDRLTIGDHCAMLSVTGTGDQVTIRSVDTVTVSGAHDLVVYGSGSPTVTITGAGDTVRPD